MRNNKRRPCKCGHPKSIHARMYFKVKTTKLPSECNFPECKCNKYRPLEVQTASAAAS